MDTATNTTPAPAWEDWSHTDPKRAGFPVVDGATLTYKSPRGEYKVSNVYAPTDKVKAWDGAHPHSLCVGSRYSCFVYVFVKVTGREPQPVPFSDGRWGIKVCCTFEAYTEDACTVEGWLSFAHGGQGFDRYDAKRLVERCYENTNEEVFCDSP